MLKIMKIKIIIFSAYLIAGMLIVFKPFIVLFKSEDIIPPTKGFLKNLLMLSSDYSIKKIRKRIYFIKKDPSIALSYLFLLMIKTRVYSEKLISFNLDELSYGHKLWTNDEKIEEMIDILTLNLPMMPEKITDEDLRQLLQLSSSLLVVDKVVIEGNNILYALKKSGFKGQIVALSYKSYPVYAQNKAFWKKYRIKEASI